MALIEAGDFRFEVDEGWGRLPDGMRAGVVTGVVVDSQDRVYLCQQQQDPPVLVLDRDGNFLDSWGSGYVVEPHTMYIGPDDVIYLADRGGSRGDEAVGERRCPAGSRQPGPALGHRLLRGRGNRAAGGRPVQPAHPALALAVRRPVRLRRLPQLPGASLRRRRAVHRVLGTSRRRRAGRFLFAPLPLGGRRGPDIRLRPQQQPYPDLRPEGEFVTQWTKVQLPTDLHIGSDGLFYLAERESGDAVEHLLTVRDGDGSILASWHTPRSHQIWPDAHGDIYLVSGTATDASKGLGTRYVKVR